MEQCFSPDEVSFSIIKPNQERLTRDNLSLTTFDHQTEIQKKIDSIIPSIESINKKLSELDLKCQNLEKQSETTTQATQAELNQLKLEILKNTSNISKLTEHNDLNFKRLEGIFTKETLEIKLLLVSQNNLKPSEKSSDLSSSSLNIQDLQSKMKNLESLMQSLNSKTENISEFLKNQNFTQDPSKETPSSQNILQYVETIYLRTEFLHNSIQDLQVKIYPSLDFIKENVQVLNESVKRLKLFEEFEFSKIFNKIDSFTRIFHHNPENLVNREDVLRESNLISDSQSQRFNESDRNHTYFSHFRAQSSGDIEHKGGKSDDIKQGRVFY